MVTVLPAMTGAQEATWHALMDLQERLPDSWTLVGGQMVHLHCIERGVAPLRPTDDADALLDVKRRPTVLFDFTQGLQDAGFRSAGVAPEGHQHRWRKDDAQIDVLIGDNLGQRGAADRRGVTGSTTLGTPGAAHVLARSEAIELEVAGRTGKIRRTAGTNRHPHVSHQETSDVPTQRKGLRPAFPQARGPFALLWQV